MFFSIIFKFINHYLVVSVNKIALAAYHLDIFFMHGILKKNILTIYEMPGKKFFMVTNDTCNECIIYLIIIR